MLSNLGAWIKDEHETIAITISSLALFISTATSWLAFRRGTLKLVRPSVIYFGPDGGTNFIHKPKVYVRALLVCTSKRGRIIESFYASVTRNGASQSFNVWVHGDKDLVRGSGLYVDDVGVAASHHFFPPEHGSAPYRFIEGIYTLKLFARLMGDDHHLLLFSTSLHIDKAAEEALIDGKQGIYFDWQPENDEYRSNIDDSRI